eukprot:scaffold4675_cov378-Prasinococcus_capsulatus_cf.AAC.2
MQSDMSGITCMVTGANSGLGYGIAEALAKRKATVYCVCRSEQRGAKAVEALKESSKNDQIFLVQCDLSSIESVRKACTQYRDSGRPLHVLVNNAGGMFHAHMVEDTGKGASEAGEKLSKADKTSRPTTPEGHELNFATNTLGTYHLTQQLLPCLQESTSQKFKSRVITVSSGGALAERLEVDDLYSEHVKGDALFVYARQKRQQLALTEHWARKHDDDITFVSMHPGWVGTPGVEKSLPYLYYNHPDLLRTVEQGADTAVWLSCLKQEKIENDIEPGAFYHDRRKSPKHVCLGGTRYDSAKVTQLVEKLDAMLADGKATL